ncbi:YggS family pyridoxal phosphate-dependent enzyme [Leeuwenhoekiella sp. A16]|uniref:YggS family pyridoxal phosphate-dependent enzyme n=1 Tax=unclassified Leeuwenhoekiella TaxID=2615029 RepID=UPI003A812AEE
MSIPNNIKSLYSELPKDVSLVAVSKTKPVSDIEEAYNTGQRIFGENKIQEMTDKWEQLPKDIEWHMIGHVQTNKVKYMAPYVSLIHSADRLKLFKEINKQAKAAERTIQVLLQVKIAEEDSKFGMPPQEAIQVLEENVLTQYTNVEVTGLMGMASFTDDQEQVKREFLQLKSIFDRFKDRHNLKTLSMGMSGDYELAIECGSNMVRIGSAIFGERDYSNTKS